MILWRNIKNWHKKKTRFNFLTAILRMKELTIKKLSKVKIIRKLKTSKITNSNLLVQHKQNEDYQASKKAQKKFLIHD